MDFSKRALVRRSVSGLSLLCVTFLALIHGLPAQEVTNPSVINTRSTLGPSAADPKEDTSVSESDSRDKKRIIPFFDAGWMTKGKSTPCHFAQRT